MSQGTRNGSARGGSVLVMAVLCSSLVGCMSNPTERLSGRQEREQLLKQSVARRDVGIDHISNGRIAMAIRELRHAMALNPNDPDTLLWLGEGNRRKGRLEEAEDLLLEALELDPAHHEARLNLSALYIQMERYEPSIVESNALFEDPIFQGPWRALTNRGWAEYKLGRNGEARASFKEALEYYSRYWPALLNLGILEKELGHYALALQYLQEVLDTEPNYSALSEANYRIGEIYVSIGRRDAAVVHFAQAEESWPTGPWGKQSQRYLKLLR